MTDANSDPALESGARNASLYADACIGVISAANAVIETANRAIGARNMAQQGHELSRESFRGMAAQEEAAFVPLYKAFVEACATAREAAANLRAIPTSDDPELTLHGAVDDGLYSQTGIAAHILRTNFGPTPAVFMEGVEVANAAIQGDIYSYGEDGFVGHVYSPPTAAERACPWCAETIRLLRSCADSAVAT
jgi:hypothetical protein